MAEDKDAFNAEALQALVGKTVQETLAAEVKRQGEAAAAAQQEREAQERADAAARNRPADPVGDMVRPYVQPAIQEARLAGQAATDAVLFYQKNPKAAKHMDEIEARFNRLMANGTAFARADIYNHLRGEKYDDFVKADQEEQRLAAERAQNEGLSVGAGGRLSGGPAKDAHEASDEELSDALKNMSF
jgi:hypothetical protein